MQDVKLRVTERALEKMREVLKEVGGEVGIRIFVTEGCCCGPQYGLALEDREYEGDRVVNVDGVKFFIDSFSAERIGEVELDYDVTPFGEGFLVRRLGAHEEHSHGHGGCSCGCGH
ncbi:MAG: iron-sulfur cluster biosynthesis family protein [Nitrososphaerota archaeon]|nr:iron-sulfur cluster assembly accessory protein [Candidatus Calditenuis fumarioli]